MNTNKMYLLTVLVMTLAGCGSLTHKKDEEAVHAVRRAAVVAISATEPVPATIGLDLGSAKTPGGASQGELIPGTDEHVEEMLKDLSNTFATRVGWKMVPPQTMVTNAGYISAYNKTMKGWQNKMPPGKGQKNWLAPQVIDFDGPRILDVAGRDDLIKALGVDAIVVAHVSVELKGNIIQGHHPRSIVTFSVYRKGDAKPIWFEGQILGEPTEESLGKTMFFNPADLGPLVAKSAHTAFTKIGSTTEQ